MKEIGIFADKTERDEREIERATDTWYKMANPVSQRVCLLQSLLFVCLFLVSTITTTSAPSLKPGSHL